MGRPLQSWKNKGLDVAAWPTKNGGISFTIRKTYKPKDGKEYLETKTYFPNDIAILVDLLQQAAKWAHEEFQEPMPLVDTRPVTPAVKAVVDGIAKTFPGAKVVKDEVDEDMIPF